MELTRIYPMQPSILKRYCILSSLVILIPACRTPKFPDATASYNRSADDHAFTVFMKEGGWCWFQEPRAIIHEDNLYIGAVRGNSNGEARVGVYDLEKGMPVGVAIVHPNLDRDDHNSPVFHVHPDGSILTVYARHNIDSFHYSRISDSEYPLQWSKQTPHFRESPHPRDRVTYMNLFFLKSEGLLYNFYRGILFNPTFLTSRDHGLTWSRPVHLFRSEIEGRQRPYAVYTTNGTDTIHVAITDAHPRNHGNSLYYFAFRNGNFYKTDGTMIKDLAEDGPLRPSEAELIYHGSMATDKPEGFESVPNSAWTSSLAIDEAGRPHIAYSLYLSNDDIRYRLASWTGQKWIDREVAFGGTCLYERESSYSGLITMDPQNPEVVFISTNVNPATGENNGGNHEIYRAVIEADDDRSSIDWEAVTNNSPVQNIRPVIVRDEEYRVVLWNRGDYRSYIDYQLDTVGFTEVADP